MNKTFAAFSFVFSCFLTIHLFCQTTNECCEQIQIENQVCHLNINQKDLLLNKIYAVHATRYLPTKDYLIAGFSPSNDSIEQALIPQVRKTLHFALGELTRPVEGFMDWENCPYAIVTQLKEIMPQLLNINCYDSFILGNLKLTPAIYLIVPIDLFTQIESQATLISYDPETTTLREAVDQFIASKDGWHIEMDSEDMEDELHPAYLNGCNINTANFFESLKENKPWLAVGLRFDPLDGEHYRLSQIERSLLLFLSQVFSSSYHETGEFYRQNNAYLTHLIDELNEHFEKWSNVLNGFEWNAESQVAYQQLKEQIRKGIALIQQELQLRISYGKTCMSAPKHFLEQYANLINQPENLQSFIDQNKEYLFDYVDSQHAQD